MESLALNEVSVNEYAVKLTEEYKLNLRNDKDVKCIMTKIDISDIENILAFGDKSANSISRLSNEILSTTQKIQKEKDIGLILNKLNKTFKGFNLEDLQKEEKGFFKKVFNKAQNSFDNIVDRCTTVGNEVDKIYLDLKKHEVDIKEQVKNLANLYESNILYYRDLEKYIVAGEMALEKLDNELIPSLEEKALNSGENISLQKINILKNNRDMLEQRVYDLKIAENVSLQNIPMLQQMQKGNFDLMRAIKSSFIITLPIFKQCLINAIVLKKQEKMYKDIESVRNMTNDFLMQNAEHLSKQAPGISKLAGNSQISLDSLETSYKKIMEGIDECRRIEIENKSNFKGNASRLEELKMGILTQGASGAKIASNKGDFGVEKFNI
ncbi:TPA: toxic anion resistance protein [Clostridioides difficile]|uniref:toxic anion resistance protein n=1 Tax=Clostridioides difficile TaxID=1496 RepID=UPI001A31A43F|nr:toxic anion resistance protein [Clostridioides difficile]EGT3642189.1 toxic anion resistance protein [Clostridioides difficile]MBH7168557.1 toxic anion resistance protein [Clostridioides difficile]MBY1346120.1 toxic anion resistance protein [Clostridioides difficile]MDI2978728.1 toxic anion resistance protein [Clostridioides difficile]MDI6151728.1 toxic anion resistance protein [Clostridioides difficile]